MQRKNHLGLISGIVILGLMALGIVLWPMLSPYNPLRGDLSQRLLPPLSSGHILGTDALGRDLAVRVMAGGRISFALSGTAVILAMVIGVVVGLLAAFRGGWVDGFLMRVVDVQLAFPFILLALTILTAVRPSPPVLILLLALAAWVLFARTVRGSAMKEINREYVQGAVVLGASRSRIAQRYVLPNLLPTIAVILTLELAALIMFEATLSYLGVGIQPPIPSWGGIMLEGQNYMRSAWWITTMPGVALFITTLGLSLISEGLRGILDPRLQR